MLLGLKQESKFWQLEPIKYGRGWKGKFKIGFERGITNVLEKDKIYLESLVLIRHLRIEAWRGWWPRVWIWASAPKVWRRKERVLNRFGLRVSSIYGQFRNKITFIP
jgi:hypothetical protein